MPTSGTEAPVDVLIDLRERMVRIETKLDLRAVKDVENDKTLTELTTRTTALETDAAVLRAQVKTLKWVGSGAIALIIFLKDLLPRLFGA